MQRLYSGSGSNARGNMSGGGGSRGSGLGRSSSSGRKLSALCTSCKAPLSQDEILMSSATEGRCVACQQLVEAQSACRVCHLPWSNNQANVVSCDACGFYMHDNCAKKGALQTKSSGGRLLTYCPHCPPPTLPPVVSGASRDGGGSGSRHASERPSRHSQAGPLSLPMAGSLPGAAASLLPQPSLGGRGERGDRLSDRNGLSPGGPLGAAGGPLQAPAALQPQPALQQVAALLQGQLRMLQTQQQALLRQYDQQLRGVTPGPPPNAFSLFQQDMFHVYQEEGFEFDPNELQPIISNAWHQLTGDERTGYEHRAQQEMAGWSADAQLYVQLYHEYETLAGHLGVPPDTVMLPKALQGMLAATRQMAAAQVAAAAGRPAGGLGSGRGPGRPPGSGTGGNGPRGGGGSAIPGLLAATSGGGRGTKRPAMDTLAGASALLGMTSRGGGGGAMLGGDDDDDDDEDYEEGTSKRARRAISPAGPGAPASRPPPRNTRLPADKLPTGIADLPQQLTVSCNDVAGTFVMDGIKVLCHCKDCADAPRAQREFHPTHWEQHCGAGTAKKWKASIKIEPGGAPEVPAGGNPMQIGKWFDMLGVEFRPAKTTGGPPVLEFTGATIRRMEVEGGSSGGGGSGLLQPHHSAALLAQLGQANQQPPQQQQSQTQVQQQQSAPLAAAIKSEPAAAPAPPLQRPPRSAQPTPPPALGNLPPAVAAASGGGPSRRTDDGPVTATAPAATATAGGPSKPQPRPVSDVDGGYGDGDGDAAGSGYDPPGPARPSEHLRPVSATAGREGGVMGYDGDSSSSRGSASDTLGPNTTTTTA